jgi:multiple sugar transport system ATP-binding protein
VDEQPRAPWSATALRHLATSQAPKLDIGNGEVVAMLTEAAARPHDSSIADGDDEIDTAMMLRADVQPSLTVRGNLERLLARAGIATVPARARIETASHGLDFVDLLEKVAADLTSLQRKRLRLAVTAIEPEALLLPESFAHLPVGEARRLRTNVLAMRRTLGGRTVVVADSFEDISEIQPDRVAVVRNELLRQIGLPEHVYQRPVDLYSAARFGRYSLLVAEATGAGGELTNQLRRILQARGLTDLVHSRTLLVGVRPEALSVDASRRGALRLPVRVASRSAGEGIGAIEQDWSQSLRAVMRRMGLGARVSGVTIGTDASVGQTIELTADPNDVMLFDATTGENVFGDHTLADVSGATTESQKVNHRYTCRRTWANPRMHVCEI